YPQKIGTPVQHDGVNSQYLDSVCIHHGVAGNRPTCDSAPAHSGACFRLSELGKITLGGNQHNSRNNGDQPQYSVGAGSFAQEQECPDGRKHGAGSPGDGIDDRKVGNLIAALQEQAVGQMQKPAGDQTEEDGQTGGESAIQHQPYCPWKICQARDGAVVEDEGRAGMGSPLGKQIPGGVYERSQNNQKQCCEGQDPLPRIAWSSGSSNTLCLAKREVYTLLPQQRMWGPLDRKNAVITQAIHTTPHHDVTMVQHGASRRFIAPEAAKEESSAHSQGH